MMKKATWVAIVLAAVFVFPQAAWAADGAAVFTAKCKMCHGVDGKKLAKADLSGATIQAKSDADLVKFLTNDAKHKTKVGDEATAKALVAFLRTLKK
jgi:mono/diheme cytochrome c family protein